jgi:23S rRNA maturation mini-RNase III
MERAMSENNAYSPPKERKDFSNERLIQQVEIKRQKFNENTRALTEKQSEAFNMWYDLLRENDKSLVKRSKECRSKRLRA